MFFKSNEKEGNRSDRRKTLQVACGTANHQAVTQATIRRFQLDIFDFEIQQSQDGVGQYVHPSLLLHASFLAGGKTYLLGRHI